jgi:hypothetical protein
MKQTIKVFFSLCVLSLVAWAAAGDSEIGIWKLNVAKSKNDIVGRGSMPRSQTITIEAFGDDGMKFTLEKVDAEGEKTVRWSCQYDGKLYPWTGAAGALHSLRRIDAYTVEHTIYIEGKRPEIARWVVSKDGKTRTVFGTGANAQGQVVKTIEVFDRQ